jgi:hypothetical protein
MTYGGKQSLSSSVAYSHFLTHPLRPFTQTHYTWSIAVYDTLHSTSYYLHYLQWWCRGSNNPERFTPQAFQKSASSNPDKTKESSMCYLETGRHNVTDDL